MALFGFVGLRHCWAYCKKGAGKWVEISQHWEIWESIDEFIVSKYQKNFEGVPVNFQQQTVANFRDFQGRILGSVAIRGPYRRCSHEVN
jgi:hypothetical protein